MPLNKEEAKKISDKIEAAEKEFSEKCLIAQKDLSNIIRECRTVESTWSQSWVGFHANLYFRNFEIPEWNQGFDSEWGSINGISRDWQEKTKEEVESRIFNNYNGISLEDAKKLNSDVIECLKNLQNIIVTELCAVKDKKGFESEKALLCCLAH